MASARVKLTIEVHVPSSWGKDCKIDQVESQATEEALNIVRRDLGRVCTIIGEPVVSMIIVPTKE